jgi:hypothetical protein
MTERAGVGETMPEEAGEGGREGGRQGEQSQRIDTVRTRRRAVREG